MYVSTVLNFECWKCARMR